MTEMRAFFTAKYAQCQLAISFLTRLPVANIAQPLPQLHQCFWAFSAVGMVIGGLVYGIFACLIIAGVPAMMSSFAAIGSGVLLTGALHEDGFADMLDGFGGGQDAHAKLVIMKDSHIGSYAVIGLIIVIGIKASSLGAVGVTLPLAVSVMVIAGASRFFMISLLTVMPPARPDGLGHHHAAGASARTLTTVLPSLLVVLAVSFFAPAYVLLIIGTMAVITALTGWLAYRQIGGQTGDICGAVQLISETLGLAMLAVLAS